MIQSNPFTKNEIDAINVICSKYENIDCIYVCTKNVDLGGYTKFTAAEFYIDFGKDANISIELREELARLFEQDNESEFVCCAYPYEGFLQEDINVKIWKNKEFNMRQIDIIFDNMIKKITETDFAKKNLSALYAAPKFLKESDTWVDFYYKCNEAMPTVKECLNFEKEISALFANEKVSCSLSHIDYASKEVKEAGSVWEA